MKREDIETLRETVSCAAVLESAGFSLDRRESTKRAMKYRRNGDIIIVTHLGRGWFDPLSDRKGDIFALVGHLHGTSFADGLSRVCELSSFQPSSPSWRKPGAISGRPAKPICEEWMRRPSPWTGSLSWQYLRQERSLPSPVIRVAIAQDALREGPYGSIWAAHTANAGKVCGWEARGPGWRGFATGGTKCLFRLGSVSANRICVTEAAIDAMSLAAIEGMREETLYLSTGGGWSPSTDRALRELAHRIDVQLVAATDGNPQGDVYADRLRAIAEEVGCAWHRLRPPADDWNEVLKERETKRRRRNSNENDVPHARRLRQGRLHPAAPAPDPAARDVGGKVGVMKD